MIDVGGRYRAGRDGAQIVLVDGSSIALAPFASICFESMPASIVGRLTRVRRRRRAGPAVGGEGQVAPQLETKTPQAFTHYFSDGCMPPHRVLV